MNNGAKASLWYSICGVVNKGAMFILVPFYVRQMTTEEYGIYTLYQSWMDIMLVFTTLNVAAHAFNNLLIQNSSDKDRVTSSLAGFVCVITTLWILIILLFKETFQRLFGLGVTFTLLIVLEPALVVLIDLWSARKRFDFEYKGVVIVSFGVCILKLALGILMVTLSADKALAAVLGYIIAQAVFAGVLFISMLARGKALFVWKYWKYVLVFNIPLIPHFLSSRVLSQADRVMINQYIGAAAAGIYGFAYKISSVMLIFNSALLATLIPWTYKKIKEGKEAGIHSNVFISAILIGTMNIGLILVAPEAMKLIGTAEYVQALSVIPPLAISAFFMYLFNLFANVNYYYEQNKLIAVSSIIAAGLNIELNAIFIPKFGFWAAGYTTLASYIALALGHAVVYQFTIKNKGMGKKIYRLNAFVMLAIIITIVGLAISIIYDYLIIRYTIAVIGAIVLFCFRKRLMSIMFDAKVGR
jgi:O-antigen/teichoic acid export membrane protein